jgi:uncharacterized protein YbjT (DUF2867 family)
MTKNDRLALLGASDDTGVHLIRLLLGRGFVVRATSRADLAHAVLDQLDDPATVIRWVEAA